MILSKSNDYFIVTDDYSVSLDDFKNHVIPNIPYKKVKIIARTLMQNANGYYIQTDDNKIHTISIPHAVSIGLHELNIPEIKRPITYSEKEAFYIMEKYIKENINLILSDNIFILPLEVQLCFDSFPEGHARILFDTLVNINK